MQSAGDYEPQSVLEILTSSNPKRRETIAWHQYDFLEKNEGCTLEELRHRAQKAASNNPEIYRDRNWLIPELNWCLERDFIRLDLPENTMKYQITRKHVEQAASEVDKYGVDWLYNKTGRSRAKSSFVLVNGKSYPSKALGFRVRQISEKSENKQNIMTTNEALAPLKRLGYSVTPQMAPDSKNETKRWKKLVATLARPAQAKFRAKTLHLYNYRCAITGCSVREALEAAHIRPVSKSGTDEASNGLLLRADLHRLFDSGHLAIDPETLLPIFSDWANNHYSEHSNRPIALPENGPTKDSFATRWKEFESANIHRP